MSARAQHPDPAPLETDDVRVVAVGAALWAVALVVLVAMRAAGVGDVQTWWIGMCAYGIALGLYGVHYCRRRRAALARDAAAGPPQRD